MFLTVVSKAGKEEFFRVEVAPTIKVSDLKTFVAVDSGVPVEHQQIFFNNARLDDNRTLQECNIKDEDLVHVMAQDSYSVPRVNRHDSLKSADAERLRLQALERPQVLEQMRAAQPTLAEAVNDPRRFSERWHELLRAQQESEAEKQMAIERLNADPFDVEAQKKIEEMIRMERVRTNLQTALDEIPESFTRTNMLYVPVIVNGEPIKAFVDSGAQATIMSPSCAERCNILHLLDTSYAGMAKGVGTAKILGRVHVAVLSIGGVALHCSFTVMEGKDVDLLLGLDMLKRHTACINLKKNILEISDVEVPFLHETEIPKEGFAAEEPLVDGPGGSKIGGRTGAIIAPEDASSDRQAGSSSSAAGPSSSGQTASSQTVPAKRQASQPPAANASGAVSQASIKAVMEISGATEQEAVGLLQATGGNVDGAVNLFFDQ